MTPLTVLDVFTKGLKVRITRGAFAGQIGEVAGISQKIQDRVQILLNILGVKMRLQMLEYAIETV